MFIRTSLLILTFWLSTSHAQPAVDADSGSRADVMSDVRIALAQFSPQTGAALDRMDEYLRNESRLGRGRVALLSLIVARELSLPGVWQANESVALDAGIDAPILDTIRLNRPSEELARDNALLLEFGRQLYRNRHVDPDTFAGLVDLLGRQQAFDAMMALTIPVLHGLLQRALGQQPLAGWNPDSLPAIPGVGTPAGTPGEFIGIGPRPPLPSDVHEDSLYRFALQPRDQLDARGREIFDRVIGPDETMTPRGPVGMTFLSPEFVDPVQEINQALRVNGTLDTRMAEIVIATTGREMNSQYQWNVHGGGAARAGAGEQVLEAIRTDGDLSGLDARDTAAIALVRAMFREDALPREAFAAAVEVFGARGAVEIAALAGDYLMMTTVYNALGMRLRPAQDATLPHRAGAPIGAEWR